MADGVKKVLMTGATGYIADQLLPAFKERYQMVLVDVSEENRRGERVEGVVTADLMDPDRTLYAPHFDGVDAVVHLANRRSSGLPLDQFFDENANVQMAYNVLRTAYEAGVPRVAMASSNHAADWYEHALIHQRNMDMLAPHTLPLSDNFYGWAKATYEHLGFLFACGAVGVEDYSGRGLHTSVPTGGRRLGVVMVRIGAPRKINVSDYANDTATYKRDLGAYLSPRDLVQLFTKAMETSNIDNEHGIPWQVVYGISDNSRAFWSLANARQVLGYQPQDDSEVEYARDIQSFLVGEGAAGGVGRVG